jgi:hypothetical protein
MPRIAADFTKISSSFGALEDGEYRCNILEVKESETKTNKLPQVEIIMEVNDPDKPINTGHRLYDYLVLRTNKGEANRMGLGALKAYAEAVLGTDAANNPEGIDTDDLVNGTVVAVIKQRSYNKKDQAGNETSEQAITNDIVKVLPVS